MNEQALDGKLAVAGTIEYRDAQGNLIKTVPFTGAIPVGSPEFTLVEVEQEPYEVRAKKFFADEYPYDAVQDVMTDTFTSFYVNDSVPLPQEDTDESK